MNTAAAIKSIDAASAKHVRWNDLTPEKLKGGLTRKLITSDAMMNIAMKGLANRDGRVSLASETFSAI